MTIKGVLQALRSGAPLNGYVTVERNGIAELSLETIDSVFIIDNLDANDSLIISVPKYKTEKFLVGDLSADGENIFYLSKILDTSLMPVALAATAAAFLIGNRKKKRVGEIKPGQVAAFAGVGLGFIAVHKLLVALGVFKGKDTAQLDNEATNPASAWSPLFYHNKPASEPWTYTINTATASAYAKELYDAFGAFNDCEECAKAVIKRLRTKANVSFLSEVFSNIYGQDLLNFLRGGMWPQDRLSDADVNELNQYVKNLPNY